MIAYRTPSSEERAIFLEWMREHMAGTVEAVMTFLDLTWDGFADLFRTVGEVRSAWDDGKLAGFLWIEKRARDLHVHGIILQPEFRGRGLGTTIFENLETEFEGEIDALELGVRASNEGAIRFYERIGFEIERSIAEIGFHVLRKALG
ncbi:GNAT family N-acetyltransferase [Candidatus Bipolaricaulota bacterium]